MCLINHSMMIKCKVTNTTKGPVFYKWVKPAINLEAECSIVVDYDPFSVVETRSKPLLMADLELKRCSFEYQLDLSAMKGLPITVSVTNTAAIEEHEKAAAAKKVNEEAGADKKLETKEEGQAKEEEDPFKNGGIQEGTIEDAKPAVEPLLGDWGGGGQTRKDVPVVDIWDGKTEEEKKAKEEEEAKAKAEAEAKAKAEAEAKAKKGKDKKKAAAKKKKPELFGDTDDAGDTLL